MLMKNKIKVGILFLLSFLLVFKANAFSISPLKYTISLNPGDDKDLVIVVKNDSNINKEYEAVVMGAQQDELGRPIFKTSSDIAESWIKFSNNKIILKSNENKDFVFTVTIPKNAPPGAHYLGLGVQENNNQNIGGQLMTIVIIQVAGTANESLILEKFYPIKKYFFNKNINYFLQVKNVGNVDLPLKANLQLFDFRNIAIDSKPIILGNKLFAQSNRLIDIDQSFDDKMFWPGNYRSLLIINYGLTNQQIIGSVNFWYWPIWFLISVGVIIIILFLVILFKTKKHDLVE